MVWVIHKELEYKAEKLKYKTFLGHAADDQNQFRTKKISRSVHSKFFSRDCEWLIQYIN